MSVIGVLDWVNAGMIVIARSVEERRSSLKRGCDDRQLSNNTSDDRHKAWLGHAALRCFRNPEGLNAGVFAKSIDSRGRFSCQCRPH